MYNAAVQLLPLASVIPGIQWAPCVKKRQFGVQAQCLIIPDLDLTLLFIRLAIRQCAAGAFTLINQNIPERRNLRIYIYAK